MLPRVFYSRVTGLQIYSFRPAVAVGAAHSSLDSPLIDCPRTVQVELHQRPGTLLDGELHRCRMVMRNDGASPLHNVRMIISHPDAFCPLSNEELQREPMSALSGRQDLPEMPFVYSPAVDSAMILLDMHSQAVTGPAYCCSSYAENIPVKGVIPSVGLSVEYLAV